MLGVSVDGKELEKFQRVCYYLTIIIAFIYTVKNKLFDNEFKASVYNTLFISWCSTSYNAYDFYNTIPFKFISYYVTFYYSLLRIYTDSYDGSLSLEDGIKKIQTFITQYTNEDLSQDLNPFNVLPSTYDNFKDLSKINVSSNNIKTFLSITYILYNNDISKPEDMTQNPADDFGYILGTEYKKIDINMLEKIINDVDTDSFIFGFLGGVSFDIDTFKRQRGATIDALNNINFGDISRIQHFILENTYILNFYKNNDMNKIKYDPEKEINIDSDKVKTIYGIEKVNETAKKKREQIDTIKRFFMTNYLTISDNVLKFEEINEKDIITLKSTPDYIRFRDKLRDVHIVMTEKEIKAKKGTFERGKLIEFNKQRNDTVQKFYDDYILFISNPVFIKYVGKLPKLI